MGASESITDMLSLKDSEPIGEITPSGVLVIRRRHLLSPAMLVVGRGTEYHTYVMKGGSYSVISPLPAYGDSRDPSKPIPPEGSSFLAVVLGVVTGDKRTRLLLYAPSGRHPESRRGSLPDISLSRYNMGEVRAVSFASSLEDTIGVEAVQLFVPR